VGNDRLRRARSRTWQRLGHDVPVVAHETSGRGRLKDAGSRLGIEWSTRLEVEPGGHLDVDPTRRRSVEREVEREVDPRDAVVINGLNE
jgi:hypothetical protein